MPPNFNLIPEKIAEIEQKIGYTFNDKQLLCCALTHSSAKKHTGYNNERLEFLGDPIYNFIIAQYIFDKYDDYDEDKLAVIKGVLISEEVASKIVRDVLKLEQSIILGKDFVKTDALPTSILGTVFEALVAAIYIDGGIEQAKAFVMRVAKDRIEKTAKEIFEGRFIKDFKSILQDYSQKKSNVLPVYRITKEEGMPHTKIFEAHVEVDGKVFGPGIGRTKKEAEQQAAKIAVEKLNIFPHPNKQQN